MLLYTKVNVNTPVGRGYWSIREALYLSTHICPIFANIPPVGTPVEEDVVGVILELDVVKITIVSLILVDPIGTKLDCGETNKLVTTVILAIIFTALQGIEYTVSSFTISDGAFGSCFYFGTGFHGLHVMIGTAFLAVGLWRVLAYHSTENHHLGLESGILYWHFVDVVWLFLFISIYYWGS